MTEKSYARRRAHALGGADTPTHRPGAESRPVYAPTSDSTKAVSTFQLSNSDVVVQQSPVGYICRIERSEGRPKIEYAGPHDRATLLRLSEVSF